MRELLLGLDIGTSACKCAVFDRTGALLAETSVEYETFYPAPGQAEQNPLDWWSGVCKGIRELLSDGAIVPREIVGVGTAGQSWAAVAIDAAGEPLCNSPLWFDSRAGEICAELREQGLQERLFKTSGNPLEPGYTLPKILWYKRHRKTVYQQAISILQSNSYIVYRLCGVLSQDVSQGYGLHCFDSERGCWDKDACALLGVRQSLLPPLFPCHGVVGGVSQAAAGECGLLAGTPVVAGGLDAACGTLGAGVIQPGQAQEQGGQAGGMSICTDHFCPERRLILGMHVLPGRWLLQGGTTGGGGVLRWFARELGFPERLLGEQKGASVFYELDRVAEQVPPGCEGLVFLPYMAGERSPLWNPYAKGVYFGLDFSKTRAHMARAAMEGVAFSLQHNLLCAAEAGGVTDTLYTVGGAAQSRLWTQLKADITGKRFVVPESSAATALGAAILAGVGVGMFSDFPEAVAKTVRTSREHQPNRAHRDIYADAYQKYLELYRRLEPMMQRER